MKTLLEEALESWREVRLGVLDEVRAIPARHFDFRPVPEVRSLREQVVHVLEVAWRARTHSVNSPARDTGRGVASAIVACDCDRSRQAASAMVLAAGSTKYR